jgi:hypothetical protein
VHRIVLGSLLAGALAAQATAQNAPGVTDTEIKIGQTMPYTGPGSRLSAPGVAEVAYMKMINDLGEDTHRPNFVNGYNYAATMVQVFKQAGNDLSRANIMRQAANLRDLELPMLLPEIKVNTSPTDYYPVQQLQLMRWDGKRWVRFGDVLKDESVQP